MKGFARPCGVWDFGTGPLVTTLLKRVKSYPLPRLQGPKVTPEQNERLIRRLVGRLTDDLRVPKTLRGVMPLQFIVMGLSRRLGNLPPAERFVTDPKLREILVRSVLDDLNMRPARESPAQVQNRLNELTRPYPGSVEAWMLGLAFDVHRVCLDSAGGFYWYLEGRQALADLVACWPRIGKRRWRWALRRAEKLERETMRIAYAMVKRNRSCEQMVPALQRACPGFPRDSYELALAAAGHIAFMESIK